MNEPTTVTYSLEEMFSRLEQKIDKLDNKLENKIDSNQKELKQDIKEFNQKLDKQSEEIANIKVIIVLLVFCLPTDINVR